MDEPKPLPKSFYRAGTADVARALLGCRLTRLLPDGSPRSVILVETEAYLGVIDRAAHTWNGRRTARVEPMWGEGGHAYVYFVYGMHFCMNVVTQGAGEPEAVLLRAGISEEDFAEEGRRKREEEKISLKVNMAGRRGGATPVAAGKAAGAGLSSLPSKQNILLLSGPAKVCAYLGITTARSLICRPRPDPLARTPPPLRGARGAAGGRGLCG